MKLLLIVLEDCKPSKLEHKFAERVHDPMLQPLLPVIQGLIRFLPASRITAEEALAILEGSSRRPKTDNSLG